MPLSDVAKGHFDETLAQAKASIIDTVAMINFGVCQGILIHALYSKEISHEEHKAQMAIVTKAMTEWRETMGSRG